MSLPEPYFATMSATWLPTMPPNQRFWSRMCRHSASESEAEMYMGAATQNLTAMGSRPAASAAARTVVIIHSATSRSAICRMNPSPTSPASLSARGP